MNDHRELTLRLFEDGEDTRAHARALTKNCIYVRRRTERLGAEEDHSTGVYVLFPDVNTRRNWAR